MIDDRTSATLRASNGGGWLAVTDAVMGGVSVAVLESAVILDKPCLHLHGKVSLENNGGFLQASLDLATGEWLDASAYRGIAIEVYGNGETYNLHLRTEDTRLVWQSYRVTFQALPYWQNLYFPFDSFVPHRIGKPLNRASLGRLGVVAIGREMQADVHFSRVALHACKPNIAITGER